MITFYPQSEGIDHINAYSRSCTWLGLRLSNFDYSPIHLPDDGKFISLEGYWYFLLTKDERLRSLYGAEAKALGRSLKKKGSFAIDKVFKQKFYSAMREKVFSNESLFLSLKDCHLPIVHYYVSKSEFGAPNIVKITKNDWVWHFYDLIRLEIQGEVQTVLFKDEEDAYDTQMSFF